MNSKICMLKLVSGSNIMCTLTGESDHAYVVEKALELLHIPLPGRDENGNIQVGMHPMYIPWDGMERMGELEVQKSHVMNLNDDLAKEAEDQYLQLMSPIDLSTKL